MYEEYTKSNITSESNIIKLHITYEKVTYLYYFSLEK